MKLPSIYHFVRFGKSEAICGEKDIYQANRETNKQSFFSRPMESRCPSCDRILLAEENESLKKAIADLKESCKKIIELIDSAG